MKNIIGILIFSSLLLGGINCFAGNIKTSQEPEIQVSGEESWMIQGNKYKIDGTMLVRVAPYPSHLYAIRILISEKPSSKHESLARAIAKYAFDNGYLDMARKCKFNSNPVVLVPNIGVAVIRRTGPSFFNHAEGYRFQFNTEELK